MLFPTTGWNDLKNLGKALVLLLMIAASGSGCTTSGMQGSGEEDAEFSDEVAVEDATTDELAEDGNAEAAPAATEEAPKDELAEEAPADAAPAVQPQVAEAPAPVEPVVQAPAPVAEASVAGTGGTEDYVVSAGDTLMKIAFQRYGDIFQWKKIASDNADQLKDPNVLPVGMKLKVEATNFAANAGQGERYVIKKGDTLGTISGTVYGTPKKWKRIWENNKDLIKNPNRIFAGFYINYIFSDQDRQEKEQYEAQGGNALGAAPSAAASDRMPASATQPGK